jgi:hypothetical protein
MEHDVLMLVKCCAILHSEHVKNFQSRLLRAINLYLIFKVRGWYIRDTCKVEESFIQCSSSDTELLGYLVSRELWSLSLVCICFLCNSYPMFIKIRDSLAADVTKAELNISGLMRVISCRKENVLRTCGNPCIQSECLVPSNFLLCSTVQPIKDSCGGLSSTGYGNIALPQCVLCINRLWASFWFDGIQSYKHYNRVQSRSLIKMWKKQDEGEEEKTETAFAGMYNPRSPVRTPAVGRNKEWCFQVRVYKVSHRLR